MSQHTKSAKVNALIARAEEAGLVVTVKDTSDSLFEQYEVEIRRCKVEDVTMLDLVRNSEAIWFMASRSTWGTSAKAFKIRALKMAYGVKPYRLRPGILPFAIDSLGQ